MGESSLDVNQRAFRNFVQGSFRGSVHRLTTMTTELHRSDRLLNRREATASLVGRLAGIALLGRLPTRAQGQQAGSPRLAARPGTPNASSKTGLIEVSTNACQASVYVPTTVKRNQRAPLVVFLHGANRTVEFFVDRFKPVAETSGVVLLAPFAGYGTWDAITETFGRDIAILDAALSWVFARWTIDPARVVLSGFSDGGTYALAVGRANGDVFGRVVAYSPGFLIPIESVGRPPILITHGRQDNILPIDRTSRVIVPELRHAGYEVDYREFDGPHAVPLPVANEVMAKLAVPG